MGGTDLDTITASQSPGFTGKSRKDSSSNGSTQRFPDGYLLNGLWTLKRRIGQGRYSDVYAAVKFSIKSRDFAKAAVAIKVQKEGIPAEGCLLAWEAAVLKDIRDCPLLCHIHENGVLEDGGHYIVMDLCSESLSEYRKRQPSGSFRPHKGAIVVLSMLDCVEAFHKYGYVHRDIKPSNFVRPLNAATGSKACILVDFGLSRRHSRDGKVLPARPCADFKGTSKYASTNSHNLKELGPRDDMFSLLYILVDFVVGRLPWLDCLSKHEVASMKASMFGHNAKRLESIPDPVYEIADHLNGLRFDDVPDYRLIRRIIQGMCTGRLSIQRPVPVLNQVMSTPKSLGSANSFPVSSPAPEPGNNAVFSPSCFDERRSRPNSANRRDSVPVDNHLPSCIDDVNGSFGSPLCDKSYLTLDERGVFYSTASLPTKPAHLSRPPLFIPPPMSKLTPELEAAVIDLINKARSAGCQRIDFNRISVAVLNLSSSSSSFFSRSFDLSCDLAKDEFSKFIEDECRVFISNGGCATPSSHDRVSEGVSNGAAMSDSPGGTSSVSFPTASQMLRWKSLAQSRRLSMEQSLDPAKTCLISTRSRGILSPEPVTTHYVNACSAKENVDSAIAPYLATPECGNSPSDSSRHSPPDQGAINADNEAPLSVNYGENDSGLSEPIATIFVEQPCELVDSQVLESGDIVVVPKVPRTGKRLRSTAVTESAPITGPLCKSLRSRKFSIDISKPNPVRRGRGRPKKIQWNRSCDSNCLGSTCRRSFKMYRES
uniref:Casein kinase I n=1 Tax=Spongospora subterranea TaxID=70186 RepID=A0A0H5RUP7_9EUKA|eukprot:CRZ12464.1 hypothetical protein [Spongospora subterranea]